MKSIKILGIDVGSVSVSIAVTDYRGEIIAHDYRFHYGEIKSVLLEMLKKVDLSTINGVAATSSAPSFIFRNSTYDPQVAIMAAAKHFQPDCRGILHVGGEKFGLISYDENGNYKSYRANTSCAAGTGSFLDQQAGRLNLSGITDLSTKAAENTGNAPQIATRCAVFAKTDLIHAQQKGYSLNEICDGLCTGLAKNICDTVFKCGISETPLAMCGGVAKNSSVVEHINKFTGIKPEIHEYSHIFGAIGAAFLHLKENKSFPIIPKTVGDFILNNNANISETESLYPKLELKLSEYPDFSAIDSRYFKILSDESMERTVEVDVYIHPEKGRQYSVLIGIDIGSTSTKAVLLDEESGQVYAGFYTRTAGQPLMAVQDIFAAADDLYKKADAHIAVNGCSTTGSGRKFIGAIVGADQITDEITAHARAASEIRPDVDTIIEIGGQDAKFTKLKNGMVTGATMNNVCAAGTGSFVEEQAKKLGCPITEFSQRTLGKMAPMASDRCTVFMERDLNHFLSQGHDKDTVLASVVHSVRDNYLMKVATESSIGQVILFQGATAKNKALVAAFEQHLKKPIIVSKYCHLTGALGAALILKDEKASTTIFKGLEACMKPISLNGEICQLCSNHCKITVADFGKEKVAYGFLCGRDYETESFVNKEKKGFDLIKTRNRIHREIAKKYEEKKTEVVSSITIGIPSALHMHEDIHMWQAFFSFLGIKTVTSRNLKEPVKKGKLLTGAEFCAPVTAFHGHVDHLLDVADYVFLPVYLEEKQQDKAIRRQYCYYTQFSSSLVHPIAEGKKDGKKKKILTPLIKYLYSRFHSKIELYRMLKSMPELNIGFMDVSSAFDRAMDLKAETAKTLESSFADIKNRKTESTKVVLLGRPYTVLSDSMNSGIPDIFASLDVDAFYQDMLPDAIIDHNEKAISDISPLLNEIHWEFASRILAYAKQIAETEDLYPVLMTSFKCTPDSFTVDYFKKIMDRYDKPYLILELDEHDSSVGYETRIEAAIRAFKNHHRSSSDRKIVGPKITTQCLKNPDMKGINPDLSNSIEGKTVVIPNWDSIFCRLLAATLKREGIDARVMTESESTIREGLKYNTGQCIPLTAIAEGFRSYIIENRINPENAVLWLSHSTISCNIKLYPHHIKSILNTMGGGIEKAGVFVGELSMADISLRACIGTYFAYLLGGLLRKAACRIRPYESMKGETDRIMGICTEKLEKSFLGEVTRERAIIEVVAMLDSIKTDRSVKRSKVAIFGDMYTRDNDVMNQDLVRFIEENGGEVIPTPYSEYARMISGTYFRKWFVEGHYFSLVTAKSMLVTLKRLERNYYKCFEPVLNEIMPEYNDDPKQILGEYGILIENTGESMDNILKIHYLVKHNPDLSLLVQASPALCCPSLVTEAMSDRIQKKTGIPVVALTYDGTGGCKNSPVIPYLKYPKTRIFDGNHPLASNDK